jgi:hypothetical protein
VSCTPKKTDVNKWKAQIDGVYLGYFPTEEDAAHAYNIACLERHREFAVPNVIENSANDQNEVR